MQLEAVASSATASIDVGMEEGKVASRSSSATSVCSTSSTTSSTSSTRLVAYCGIDVETVIDVSDVQSFHKGQLLPVILSEPESDVELIDDVPVASIPASHSVDVATDTEDLLSVLPQAERETRK